LIGLFFGPWVIRRLTAMKVGQAVRTDGPQTHLVKTGTPTMGGVLILIGIAISTLLWADLSNRFIWIVLIVTLGFGAIGWVDDYRKVVYRDPKGMSSKEKILWQSLIGLFAAIYLAFSVSEVNNLKVLQLFMSWVQSGFSIDLPAKSNLYVPFFKEISYPLGVLGFIVLSYLVIVGSSNAVNLTDGLDGLVIMPVILVGAALGVFAYVSGNIIFSKYLNIMYIPHLEEMVIFAGAFVGACVGFLWYNAFPAQVFMGDTGSLALGGIIASFALVVRKELLIPILCGIFLIENLSVMIQVSYFKYTKKKYGEGRRIFKMSPLHHHYQKSGFHEAKIVTRFWIIGIMLAIFTIITLKIR
jgi:phospho-N-acetylmuramoyl-pentapeptide-transferase